MRSVIEAGKAAKEKAAKAAEKARRAKDRAAELAALAAWDMYTAASRGLKAATEYAARPWQDSGPTTDTVVMVTLAELAHTITPEQIEATAQRLGLELPARLTAEQMADYYREDDDEGDHEAAA